MNPLYEKLPRHLEINGVSYPIRTDFRCILRLINEIKKANEPHERLISVLSIFKKEIPQTDMKCAVCAVTDFIAGKDVIQNNRHSKNSRKTFSYRQDAAFIISDFRNYYGIDLTSCKYLHWQMFQMFLEGLPDSSGVKMRIGYRSVDVGKIRDRQEKNRIIRIQRMIEIREEDEEEGEIGERFADAMWGDD